MEDGTVQVSNGNVIMPLAEQFFDILEKKQITTVFQPIISLRDGSIYGYEALSRGPQNSDMQNPNALFDYAEKLEKTWDLELLCRSLAIEAFYKLNTRLKLFLNVNPKIIHDIKFKQGFTKDYILRYGMDPEDIIFEITERGSIDNISDLVKTINNYKNQNYKIAIDDAGAGYSGLNMISDLNPHFIKLDINLIRGIDKDVTRQSLIKSFAEFASLTNTYLVAEGIETEKELLKLIEIGIHFGQGFFLQRPSANLAPIPENVVHIINEANRRKNHLYDQKSSDLYIGNITTTQKTMNQHILMRQIYDLMENEPSISGFCITEEEQIIGVITRSELYRNLSGLYGFTLYAKRPIKDIMSKAFLQVDYYESIENVSKKAMGRDNNHLYDFISVTKEDKYFGIVTVKDLLEKTIQVEVNNAKHLNPLSGLPGNLMIEKKLEESLSSCTSPFILYLDINNFKAYNDVYGFENGDRIIKCLARILRQCIVSDSDFIGHIGGDDFVAIVNADDVTPLCEKIIQEFDSSIISFYNQYDLDRGYITTKNRRGLEEDFPLLSISVVAVPSSKYMNVSEMTVEMAQLKKACKQYTGSKYLLQV